MTPLLSTTYLTMLWVRKLLQRVTDLRFPCVRRHRNKCIINNPGKHNLIFFWHGYVLREEDSTASYSSHSVSHVLHQRTASHSSYILHLIPYTLRLTSYILHLTSYALCLTPYTLCLMPYVLHLMPYALRLTPYGLRLTSYVLHLASYTLRLMPYALRLTSYILHLTSYILHLTSYILYHIVSYSVSCDMYTSCV
jgi:hypothetical protein